MNNIKIISLSAEKIKRNNEAHEEYINGFEYYCEIDLYVKKNVDESAVIEFQVDKTLIDFDKIIEILDTIITQNANKFSIFHIRKDEYIEESFTIFCFNKKRDWKFIFEPNNISELKILKCVFIAYVISLNEEE